MIKKVLLLKCFCLCFFAASAQSSINSAGNTDASSNISYSIGQVFFQPATDTEWTVLPGIQQNYQLYSSNLIDQEEKIAQLKLYPNPTTDYIELSFPEDATTKYQVMIFDLSGVMLKLVDVKTAKHQINVSDFKTGTYLIYIRENDKTIQTFKMIKQ